MTDEEKEEILQKAIEIEERRVELGNPMSRSTYEHEESRSLSRGELEGLAKRLSCCTTLTPNQALRAIVRQCASSVGAK